MVSEQDQFQGPLLYDSCNEGNLQVASLGLHSRQVGRIVHGMVPINSALSLSLFSNVSSEEMLFTEAELTASMPRIETINFHQVRCLRAALRRRSQRSVDSLAGNRSEWREILVLPCRSRSRCSDVHDRNSRCEGKDG